MTSAEPIKIPEGYKQTEVGVIPEDWKSLMLSDLGELTSSKRIFEGDYVQNGIPFYRGQEISQLLNREKLVVKCHISEEKYSFLKNRFGAPQRGDILITAVGTLGNALLIDSDSPFYIKDGNLIWLRKIKPLILDLYLIKQLEWLREKIIEGAIGSSQKALTIIVLKKLEVPVPSIQEQTAIANALTDVDNLIASLETLIAKKSAIKTAAMQQLLTGKKRLPGFENKGVKESEKQGTKASENKAVMESEQASEKQGSDQLAGSGSTNQATQSKASNISVSLTKSAGQTASRPGYKQTELGEIPEDWEVKDIGELFTISAGGDLRKNEYSEIKTIEAPFPIFSNAIQRKGLYGYCKTFDHDGDFITITARGGIGHAEYRNEKFCSIGRLLVLLPSSFVNCMFASNYINQYLNFANESTGVPQLTAPQVSKYKLIIPSLEEQTAIANVLSDMDTELDALQQRLNKTKIIKQGMMQELLTGKTRLV